MQQRFQERMKEAEARALEASFLELSFEEKEGEPNDLVVAVAMIDNSQWPTKVVKTSNLEVSMHSSNWQESLELHDYKTKNHKAGCSTQGNPTTVRANQYGFWGAECGCGNLRVYAMDVFRHWLVAIDRYVDTPHISPDDSHRIADQAAEIRREWLVQWRTAAYAQKAPAGLLPILLQRFPELEKGLRLAAATV